MLRINGGIVMIDLQEKTLQSFLYKAKERAHKVGKTFFISWTEEISPVMLINVFNEAKNKGKNRQFWINSESDFSIVGIGTAKTITATEDRFHTLQEKWEQLIEEAVVYDPYKSVGTGAIALGGMDFDPRKE